jgi:hypothetical protein
MIFFDISSSTLNSTLQIDSSSNTIPETIYYAFINNNCRKRLVTLWRRDGSIANQSDYVAFEKRFPLFQLAVIHKIERKAQQKLYMPLFGCAHLVCVENGTLRLPTQSECDDFGMIFSGKYRQMKRLEQTSFDKESLVIDIVDSLTKKILESFDNPNDEEITPRYSMCEEQNEFLNTSLDTPTNTPRESNTDSSEPVETTKKRGIIYRILEYLIWGKE